MFRKYEKTYHVFRTAGKRNLSKAEVKQLLAGKVVVEEKLDGANAAIIRNKTGFALQKRGSLVGASEHEQFDWFNNWAYGAAYERIMALPVGTIVYGELLYAVHTLHYTTLPELFMVFDVCKGQRWLRYERRQQFCADHGFHMVPLIAYDSFTKDQLRALVPSRSVYGVDAEGVVVKRYTKHEYFRGKIVRPEFLGKMSEEHWSRLPVVRNFVTKGS